MSFAAILAANVVGPLSYGCIGGNHPVRLRKGETSAWKLPSNRILKWNKAPLGSLECDIPNWDIPLSGTYLSMSLRRQHTPGYQLMLQRLRRVRRKAGLTQAEVARALGTTQAYVSKSESGERRMDPLELNDFARIYGTSVETLLPPSKAPRLAGGVAPPTGVAEQPIRPNRGRASKRTPQSEPK